MKDEKDPEILKGILSLARSSPFLRCNPCFPLAYKRESRAPQEGHLTIKQANYRSRPDPIEPSRTHRTSNRSQHKHTAEEQPSSRHPFIPSIRDLGPIPLSPVCNPYRKLSVLVTRAAATNWT